MSTMAEIKQAYWDKLSNVAGVLATNLTKVMMSPGKFNGDVVNGGQFWGSDYTITVNSGLSARDDWAQLESVDPYLAQNLLENLATEFVEFRRFKDWCGLTRDKITPEMIRILNMVTHRRTFHENCQVSQQWQYSHITDDVTIVALDTFLLLYPEGSTHDFYEAYLHKSIPPLKLTSTTPEIHDFVHHRCGKKNITNGGRHAYYRAIKRFFNWAYSPASNLGLKPTDNPITYVVPPKRDHRIMPAQDLKSIQILISHVDFVRDRAIISLLIDSGGRLSEISEIYEDNILWDKRIIKVIAKGGHEVLMPFSPTTEALLKDWLAEYQPNGGTIWGITKAGIVSMLRKLERKSGIKCNAHTFRRGFAAILRRAGIDSLDIMQLGHWKTPSMVQRYTESVDFEDSQKHYKAPMEQLMDSTSGLIGVANGLTKNAKCRGPESNWGHADFQSAALPTELPRRR